jgi:hypothetical protein
MAHPSDREDDTPTIPRRESSFLRFVPSHDGQVATRSAVTKASNGLSQSRHSYSNKGMLLSLLASRFSLLASRFSLLASRFSLLASRFIGSHFSL